jgi:hypothetical protein
VSRWKNPRTTKEPYLLPLNLKMKLWSHLLRMRSRSKAALLTAEEADLTIGTLTIVKKKILNTLDSVEIDLVLIIHVKKDNKRMIAPLLFNSTLPRLSVNARLKISEMLSLHSELSIRLR